MRLNRQPSPHLDTQETVHRFNEEQEIQRSFDERRLLRRLAHGVQSPEVEEILDLIAWRDARTPAPPRRWSK